MPSPTARVLSWLQMCLEADPDFEIDLNQPEQYEFSNGRVFYHAQPFYDVSDIGGFVIGNSKIGDAV